MNNINAIHGNSVLLEVFSEAEELFVPFLCARDMSINFNVEMIGTTTPNTGKWNTYKARRIDWDVSISGITSILGTGRSIFHTVSPTAIMAQKSIRMTFTDDNGNKATFVGNVLLKSAAITGNQDTFSDFENGLQGSGAYTLTVKESDGDDIALI